MLSVFVLALILMAAAMLAVVVVRRRFVIVMVNGTSMAPALRPGDRVLVRRGAGKRLRPGTVVVLRQPDDGCRAEGGGPPAGWHREWVIKRVAAADGDTVPDSVRHAVHGARVVPSGKLVVLGDSEGSADSRVWGFYVTSHVLGAVVARLGAAPYRREMM
jgi:signal peptidase I